MSNLRNALPKERPVVKGGRLSPLLDVMRNSKYDMGIKILTYDQLEVELFDLYQKSKGINSLDELRELSDFWVNVMEHLKSFCKTGYEQIQSILKREAILLEQDVLSLVSSSSNPKKLKTLREFIIEKSIETGIWTLPPVLDVPAIVHKACMAVQLPVTQERKVQKQIQEILNKDADYETSLVYDNKDPLIKVINELLRNNSDARTCDYEDDDFDDDLEQILPDIDEDDLDSQDYLLACKMRRHNLEALLEAYN